MKKRTKEHSTTVRKSPGRLMLVASRLVYAGLTGGSLALATVFDGDRDSIGKYVYYIGAASAISAVGSLGVDRVVARRIAGGEVQVGLPLLVVHIRLIEALLVAILFASVYGTRILDIPAAGFCMIFFYVASRVFYVDLESIWIAGSLSTLTLAIALVVNGVVSGVSVYAGAVSSSSTTMIIGSALGNLLAIVCFFAARQVKVMRAPLPRLFGESRGIASSLTLSVAYSKVDLLVLAIAGASLPAVAIYGVITRIYDALLIIRGSLAQQDTRDIAKFDLGGRFERVVKLSVRFQLKLFIACAVGLIVLALSPQIFRSFDDSLVLCMAAVAGLPLFFSHMPTSAAIFADKRTHLLFAGSLITCALSILVKVLLISKFGVLGAVVALNIVEWLSCCVFTALYFWGLDLKRVGSLILLPVLIYSILSLMWFLL